MGRNRTWSLSAAALALALAGQRSAQLISNDVPLNNGGDVWFAYSNPSAGAPTGTVPPDLAGDLYWTVLAGDRVLFHQTSLGGVVEIDGYFETIFDSDWSTPPSFYDRSHGPALPGPNGTLEPAFFQSGWSSETLVSLGSTGFPDPCKVAPWLCTTHHWPCPDYTIGYLVDVQFSAAPGSGLLVPADGTSASDHAVTWFVPGGMTASGGVCGLGDFSFQDVHSIDETMVGLSDGSNPYGGFQVAGSGPVPEAVTSTVEANVTFRNPMLSGVAKTAAAAAVETAQNGGGAKNALALSVGAGGATLGVEVRSRQDTPSAHLAFVGASFGTLAAPGVDLLGARVLIAPTPLLGAAVATWNGPVVFQPFTWATREAVFTGVQVPVPAFAAGTDLYLQGVVLDYFGGTAENTNVWRTSFQP